jgi:hypothetical protein
VAINRQGVEPDPQDRVLCDLLTLGVISRVAGELFDGDMRDRIRNVVRLGLLERFASQLPAGVTLGDVVKEARS